MAASGFPVAAPIGLVRSAAEDPALSAWLGRVDQLVDAACRRWDLDKVAALPAQYSVVLEVRQPDGAPAVLKVIPPDDFAALEVPALRAYDGESSPRLLAYDETLDAALLERVGPARPLSHLPDDEATRVLATVMRRLWTVPASRLQPPNRLSDWATQRPAIMRSRAGGRPGLVPPDLLDQATEILRCWDSSVDDVILHGDLHHANVLSSDRCGWVAIDPCGRIGHREADVAAMLRNPWGAELDVERLRARNERRLDILRAMLDLDLDRCRQWAFANSLDLAIWSAVSGRPDDFDHLFAVALSLRE
ncbi:aminoglycoside phosphotransferase family protein [Streptomyces sp. B21-105]|uniref:aminoglycoside phosphotransferase family protein n=1 Tax=Streptomyces sp. B21-105 TaxID=3039417 RepID=UPI002FEE9FDA